MNKPGGVPPLCGAAGGIASDLSEMTQGPGRRDEGHPQEGVSFNRLYQQDEPTPYISQSSDTFPASSPTRSQKLRPPDCIRWENGEVDHSPPLTTGFCGVKREDITSEIRFTGFITS